MTPSEYEGWQRHIVRYPPAEFLLALVLSSLLQKSDKVYDLTGFWLESPLARKVRKEREKDEANRARRDMIQAMYRAKKEREAAEGKE